MKITKRICLRQDSNLQSPDSKSGALSVGPHRHFVRLLLDSLVKYNEFSILIARNRTKNDNIDTYN